MIQSAVSPAIKPRAVGITVWLEKKKKKENKTEKQEIELGKVITTDCFLLDYSFTVDVILRE